MNIMVRKPVSVDEPGDCSCCSIEGTTSMPVYHANLTDPEDATYYLRLCGPCFDDVERELRELQWAGRHSPRPLSETGKAA